MTAMGAKRKRARRPEPPTVLRRPFGLTCISQLGGAGDHEGEKVFGSAEGVYAFILNQGADGVASSNGSVTTAVY